MARRHKASALVFSSRVPWPRQDSARITHSQASRLSGGLLWLRNCSAAYSSGSIAATTRSVISSCTAKIVDEVSVVTLGPHMVPGLGFDQLCSDADAGAGFAYAAFEHIAHAELASDLLHVDRATLVGEGAVAGDDEKPPHLRQRGDDLLDHAV